MSLTANSMYLFEPFELDVRSPKLSEPKWERLIQGDCDQHLGHSMASYLHLVIQINLGWRCYPLLAIITLRRLRDVETNLYIHVGTLNST